VPWSAAQRELVVDRAIEFLIAHGHPNADRYTRTQVRIYTHFARKRLRLESYRQSMRERRLVRVLAEAMRAATIPDGDGWTWEEWFRNL
jgi:hypothetical protein